MRSRNLIGRHIALILVLALTAFAPVALVACGAAPFSAATVPDISAVAADAGAVVLDQGTAKNYFPGGQEAFWYVIGREGSEKAAALVSVLTFKSEKDRNAALREIANRMRAGAPTEAAYTYGNAVVRISRISDKAVVRELDKAMRAAGMK